MFSCPFSELNQVNQEWGQLVPYNFSTFLSSTQFHSLSCDCTCSLSQLQPSLFSYQNRSRTPRFFQISKVLAHEVWHTHSYNNKIFASCSCFEVYQCLDGHTFLDSFFRFESFIHTDASLSRHHSFHHPEHTLSCWENSTWRVHY